MRRSRVRRVRGTPARRAAGTLRPPHAYNACMLCSNAPGRRQQHTHHTRSATQLCAAQSGVCSHPRAPAPPRPINGGRHTGAIGAASSQRRWHSSCGGGGAGARRGGRSGRRRPAAAAAADPSRLGPADGRRVYGSHESGTANHLLENLS